MRGGSDDTVEGGVEVERHQEVGRGVCGWVPCGVRGRGGKYVVQRSGEEGQMDGIQVKSGAGSGGRGTAN